MNTLSDSGGAANYRRHEHHVIPRAFGGEDGPTVSLCSSHHDLMHMVALRLISGSTYGDLVEGLTSAEHLRIMYLASRIKLASDYSRNDPNKLVIVSYKWTRAINKQLSEIAKFKGKPKEEILKALIQESHRHLFPKK